MGSWASLGGPPPARAPCDGALRSPLPQFEEPVVLPDLDDQTDHRQWTQQHLDAADLRVSAMAPTPPQGEADADCMDVNVRGPGRCAAGHRATPEALRFRSSSSSSPPGSVLRKLSTGRARCAPPWAEGGASGEMIPGDALLLASSVLGEALCPPK